MKAVMKILFSRKATAISAIFIVLLILVALFADVLAPYGINDQNLKLRNGAPSAQHPLGTDSYGRDVLSRLIYGSRLSLLVAFVSVVVAGVIGSLIGLLAGFCGGIVDSVIMRLTDALMTFPTIVFALGIKALCLLLGALGIAGMWAAIFADVGVMVIAVLNATRALYTKDLTKN